MTMSAPDLAMLCLTILMVGACAAAAARLSRGLALGVTLGLTTWLALAGGLARAGLLSAWTSLPPRLPLLPMTFFVTMVVLGRTKTMRELLAITPRSWPIAIQVFRVGVELTLFALYAAGRAPRQMTFEGRNMDIVVGLTAPLVAWLVHRRGAPGLAVAWNLMGIGVLANTIFTGMTSAPGPLHRDWPGAPFTALAEWPVVWLPAFLAPLAIVLHVTSLRQALPLLRRSPASDHLA
jgi:hypothetical protein